VVVILTVGAVTGSWTLAAAECGNGTPTTDVTAPGGNPTIEAQFVHYFESEGIPPTASAGIVGNLVQESSLNPDEPGGYLAQWNPRWWASAAAWISAHGQNPNTAAGQLMYIAANVNEDVDGGQFYPGLSADLEQATTPQQAALVWMNDYEQCRGAGPRGSISFTPDSQCQAERRESYAAQAVQAAAGSSRSGSNVFVSTQPSGTCNASYPVTGTGSVAGYANPFEKTSGLVWERTDQGVDARMNAGSPLLAFAPSKVAMIVPDFYAGEPAIVFQVTAGPMAGKWWYWSEQIQPTVSQGQTVAAGQTVATYAPSGTGIEIGWWTPNGGYPLGHPGYEEGLATNSGGDFRYLLNQLGANAGNGAGMSSGPTLGTTNYPTGNPGP
jgi:Phage tail lysozyme